MDLRVMIEPQQGATYDEQAALAKACESAGISALFRSDHYLAIGDSPRARIGPSDSCVTLAGLSRETSTLRLGTMLSSATFRLPGPLAIMVAEVDQMSGGRIELGLGAGWYEAEHRAYGIPFPAGVAERRARQIEQLEIISGLWRTKEDETFSYSGRFYELTDSPGLPKPLQRPHPPLIVGGKGRRRLPEMAARYADELNASFETVENVREMFRALNKACNDFGRAEGEVVCSVALSTVVGNDTSEAERRAQSVGRELDEFRATGLGGAPSEVKERLSAYREAGATRVYLQLQDVVDLTQIEVIGEHLVPIARDLG